MNLRTLPLALVATSFFLPASANAQVGPCTDEIATVQPFLATSNGPVGGAVYFDMTVTKYGGVGVQQIELNVASAAGTSFNTMVWAHVGTYVGHEGSNTGWFLATTGPGVSAGPNQPTLVDVTDINIPMGSYGACVVLFGAAQGYTAGNGSNQSYANADISMTLGAAGTGLFNGAPASPVVWNGKIYYDCTPPPPMPYCAPGVSTNQCSAAISANHQPSASFANSCFVNVYSVEGEKQGLMFYGVDNTGFTPVPWGASSSFLCVKPPTQRTPVQNSAGTLGQCDGMFTLDWNAYVAANPSALGQPFTAGRKIYLQGWYRDPPSPSSTNLSNALEMTVYP